MALGLPLLTATESTASSTLSPAAMMDARHAPSPQPSPSPSPSYSTAPAPPPLTVAVTLRRGVVAPTAIVLVAVLVLLTLVLQHGISLRQVSKATHPASAIEAMVDSYNSYSGSLSAAVQRPVEIALIGVVQVLTLRLLAPLMLRITPSRTATLAVMALAALLGFLLTNSLAALNVQQRELPVAPVILASDLSIRTNGGTVGEQPNVTSVAKSVSEDVPRNSITNTVLRSLLVPRDFDPPAECNARGMPGFEYARDTVDYEILKRD